MRARALAGFVIQYLGIGSKVGAMIVLGLGFLIWLCLHLQLAEPLRSWDWLANRKIGDVVSAAAACVWVSAAIGAAGLRAFLYPILRFDGELTKDADAHWRIEICNPALTETTPLLEIRERRTADGKFAGPKGTIKCRPEKKLIGSASAVVFREDDLRGNWGLVIEGVDGPVLLSYDVSWFKLALVAISGKDSMETAARWFHVDRLTTGWVIIERTPSFVVKPWWHRAASWVIAFLKRENDLPEQQDADPGAK